MNYMKLVILLTLLSQAAMAAPPPHLIPFQGHLARPRADMPGKWEAVPDGQYTVSFTLYRGPVGGESKIWGPERHEAVTVINGLVNALIGAVNALPADRNDLFASPVYVGITIDADGNAATPDTELVPRQVLLPSLYAHNAGHAKTADHATSATTAEALASQSAQHLAPTGAVLAFSGDTPPEGWLLCTGDEVDRTAYPQLFDAIGTAWGSGDGSTSFNVPDTRGMFLRGVDSGAGNNPTAGSRIAIKPGGNSGDAVGSTEADNTARPATAFNVAASGGHSHTTPGGRTSIDGAHTHSLTGGDAETRPINVGVKYIIKY